MCDQTYWTLSVNRGPRTSRDRSKVRARLAGALEHGTIPSVQSMTSKRGVEVCLLGLCSVNVVQRLHSGSRPGAGSSSVSVYGREKKRYHATRFGDDKSHSTASSPAPTPIAKPANRTTPPYLPSETP